MSLNWNEFAKEVHQNAVEKGWYDPKPSFADMVVNFHCELSEAVEEYRRGMAVFYYPCNDGNLCEDDIADHDDMSCNCRTYDPLESDGPCENRSKKPCGVAVELADCILRILDCLAEAGVDIDANLIFATSAPKDLIETIALCHSHIAAAFVFRDRLTSYQDELRWCMETILDWARLNNVPMEAVLRAKHEYNKTRPYRHGGQKL